MKGFTVDSLFTQHGYVIEIEVDRTSAPKFAFDIYKYEHFGNYEKIEVRDCQNLAENPAGRQRHKGRYQG